MTTKLLDELADHWAFETSVRLTQQMVRTDSTCGKEGLLARQLEEELKALDIGKVWCEEVSEDLENTLMEVDSGKPGPHLLFTGHLDTKPVCEGWTRDPFDGAIEDGHLFGHAVMDMKAGLGCQVGAIKSLVDGDVDFNGKITFAAVCDHMGQQTGSIDLFRRHEFDHCVLGELTGMQIYVAHRGRYYFDISTVGLSAHTCHKDLAINAIEKMLPVAEEISKLRYFPDIPPAMKDLVGPELYIAVGRIFGGLFPGGPSMIPDRCTIRVDTRPQPGVPLEEVKALIEQAIECAKARDKEIKVELEVADVKNSFMVDPEERVVKCLREAWEEVMDKPASLVGGSWLGDTASFGHLCATVIFGPGGEPVYQPDESMALSDLETATRINALTAVKLLQAA
ncbi:MAG: M20/M25/M40 family metallo-hydrolase [Alphaproteobacteria bacterium]|jgi:acetylornithine deacetylase/succinyl-diaminopimelate desuccinylase-like protein|nr:M20/M25/M40 family metallo-hydrolase [Alphaproteobacteria bacterium]MDP6574552.1 M20/M25/M40 family metallo-hydrolase [Rhodospirillales bacterium]MDP6772722.1 M20/M25/M40 family metallo-hydrolase [Rhodospirillales bacterium]